MVKKYLDKNLSKGFLRPSSSLVTSLVILVRKLGDGLRVYINYRALNTVTIKNRYLLPKIRETLNRLYKAKYYTKLNIITTFNNIRIKKESKFLTAFSTRYGQFEYLVMPFSLCNAPLTFQSYINTAL